MTDADSYRLATEYCAAQIAKVLTAYRTGDASNITVAYQDDPTTTHLAVNVPRLRTCECVPLSVTVDNQTWRLHSVFPHGTNLTAVYACLTPTG